MQTIELALFANRKTKKKMLQAINQNPFKEPSQTTSR
jgi:hypothetical protein